MLRIFSIVLCFGLCVSLALAQDTFEVETYTAEDGSITFDYPADWELSAQEEHYSLSSPSDEEPVAYIQWGAPQPPVFFSAHGAGSTPLEFSQYHVGETQTAVIEGLPIEPDEITSDGIVVFNIEGRQATYYLWQEQAGETSYGNFAVDVGGYIVLLQIVCPEGGNACIFDHQDEFFLIVKSLRYTPPEPVFSGNEELPNVLSLEIMGGRRMPGELSLFYPEDWYVVNNQANTFVLQTTTEQISPYEMQSGELLVGIYDPEYHARVLRIGQPNPVNCEDNSEVVNLMTVLQRQYLLVSVETVHPHEFGDYEGLWYSYSDDLMGDVLLISVDVGDGNIVGINAYARRGEMSLYEDTLLAIAETLDYTQGECNL